MTPTTRNETMNCIQTKDELLQIINGIDSVDDLYRVAETIVIPVLKYTHGLWKDLGYSYKAAEISDRMSDICFRYLGTCQHAKTHEKLLRIRQEFQCLGNVYRFK